MRAHELLRDLPDPKNTDFQKARLEKIDVFLRRLYQDSPLYREKFDQAGWHPSRVKSWSDFRELPVSTDKGDERRSQDWSMSEAGHPLGMHLCVPEREVLAVTGTSGTTGMPAFTYQYTKGDLDRAVELWRRATRWMEIEQGDLVFNLMGYSMGSIGVPSLYAFWQMGIRSHPIPAESGTQRILYLMDLFRPDYLICTPSLLEYLAERAFSVIKKNVGDLRIKGILVAGEPGGGLTAYREKIRELYGSRLYDAQIGSLGICNISCHASEYTGLHQLAPDMQIWPEDFISVDGKPVEPEHGQRGRALLTSFVQEARPVLKLDMGDVWQLWTEPCPACGFRGLRYSIVGRSDDMLIVKGVNLYPAAIKDLLQTFRPRATGQFRILLDSPPPLVRPPLRLRVEHSSGMSDMDINDLCQAIKDRMHGVIKVTPAVEMVPEGMLRRSEQKTRYIEMISDIATAPAPRTEDGACA